MVKLSKRMKQIEKESSREDAVAPKEALEVIKSAAVVKFDETIEVSMKLGVDPKKADQMVRGSVKLPHGTGKACTVVVFTKGDNIDVAKKAGAQHIGDAELVKKIQGGWLDFDVVIATPDCMRELAPLAKVLGPRGLMPSPKAGTVTTDVATAVTEVLAGRLEVKVDKESNLNTIIGKKSFSLEQLVENFEHLLGSIKRMKPQSSKGTYLKQVCVASTMGPGIKIDLSKID
ncbi:MAG: 50S ribosomal protein L1 [Chlamydiia bacterium]|nr:50S ribosomal protein L1 [Chlamydiia bacterium]